MYLLYYHLLNLFFPPQAGGGRNEVDPRFVSLFCAFNVTFPSSESLFKIYSSILAGHLKPFTSGMYNVHSTLASIRTTFVLKSEFAHRSLNIHLISLSQF